MPNVTPGRYRKKPVVITAMPFDGSEESAARVLEWMGSGVSFATVGPSGQRSGILIDTLEGDHWASPGDWIIRGVDGEYYPCKPAIFAVTYEAVDA